MKGRERPPSHVFQRAATREGEKCSCGSIVWESARIVRCSDSKIILGMRVNRKEPR